MWTIQMCWWKLLYAKRFQTGPKLVWNCSKHWKLLLFQACLVPLRRTQGCPETAKWMKPEKSTSYLGLGRLCSTSLLLPSGSWLARLLARWWRKIAESDNNHPPGPRWMADSGRFCLWYEETALDRFLPEKSQVCNGCCLNNCHLFLFHYFQ